MRLLLVLVLFAAPLAAQQASAYLPLDHWAMPYVEQLIAAGVIVDPTPLTRPLKQADVVRALRDADTVTTSGGAAATVRRLLEVLPRDEEGPRYRLDGQLGVAAATYARRDPLAALDSAGPRQAGPEHGYASGGLALTLTLGPVVAATHPYFDTRLKYDPDWFGRKNRKIAGRAAEAYISAQWRYGEVFFGRLDRNWGPSGVQGILLSDNPYGLDHLGITLGTRRLQLQAIATQLDDRDSAGVLVHRFMAQHRLWVRPSDSWTFTLWEASVLSGAGREFEPWYLNILNLALLEQLNTGTNVNSFVGVDFERHGDVTLYGQVMLDDIQVDRSAASDKKPISYALTLGAKGRAGAGAVWNLLYTQVSNLAYRNENNLQVPLYHFLGTGRNFDDYDQATLKLGLLPDAALLIEPELTLLRQGEGDPRLPHPAVPDYPTTATIFQGVVERTVRVALSGSYAPGAQFGVRFDGGLHRISNYLHMSGQTRTKFVGSLSIAYRFSTQGALP